MNKENMENSVELPKEQASQETVLKEKVTNVEPPLQEEKPKVEEIEKPKPSAEEIKESNVEIVRMPPSAEELEQIKQQKLEQEQRLLQNLK